ncbi:MAG: type II toxin-antitoxin system RelE/ParE family toxin [Candidatus Nanohalobium sp.]
MKYEIRIDLDARDFLQSLDSKSKGIVKRNLRKLQENPYPRPQNDIGDVEKVTVKGREVYRMHISRSYTAFYTINEEKENVVVTEIVDIDKAHKMYD